MRHILFEILLELQKKNSIYTITAHIELKANKFLIHGLYCM